MVGFWTRSYKISITNSLFELNQYPKYGKKRKIEEIGNREKLQQQNLTLNCFASSQVDKESDSEFGDTIDVIFFFDIEKNLW